MAFKDVVAKKGFNLLSSEQKIQLRDAYYNKKIATKPGYSGLSADKQKQLQDKFVADTNVYIDTPTPETQYEVSKEGYSYAQPKDEIITEPLTQPTTADLTIGPSAQTAAKALTAPGRGMGGLAVTLENLSAKQGLQQSLERGKEAIETPEAFKSERTSEGVSQFIGSAVGHTPLFALAATVAGTGMVGMGTTLAGLSALEEKAETGKVSPGRTAVAGTLGMALGPAAKSLGKFTKYGLEQVKRTTVSPQIGYLRNVMELASEATHKQTAKALAPTLPGIAAQVSEKTGINSIDTTLIQEANAAARGDQTAAKAIMKKISSITGQLKGTNRQVKMLDLIETRGGSIGEETLQSQYFIHNANKALSPAEAEALTFMLEKGGRIPKQYLDKLPNKQVTKTMREWKPIFQKYFDKEHDLLKEINPDVGFRKNYIPHAWDIEGHKGASKASKTFSLHNPFTKQRKFNTLLEGMEAGYKPKTTNIVELVQIYDNYRIKTIANQKFLTALKGMADETGQKLIQPISAAPKEWPRMNFPELGRALGKTFKGQVVKGQQIAVHPDIAKGVDVVLSKPWDARWLRNIEAVKGMAKKLNMSFSLFHHAALEESLFGSVGFVKGLKINAKIAKNAWQGKIPAFANFEMAKDAAQHGVTLNPMEEFAIGQIESAFKGAERLTSKIPGISSVVKGAHRFNTLWDKGLWDYLHGGFKVYGYEAILEQNLKRMTSMPIKQVKHITAQQVNDMMGGQNWEKLMIHPKFRQTLNLAFLAPDWNISAMRQFTQAFKKGPQGTQGRRFWGRAALYMFGFSNIMNYANTQRVTGKGRWMWENEKGRKTRIFVGKNDKGQNVYARQGKQFREPFEMMTEPAKFIGRKTSPLVQAAWEQISGTSTTGFPQEFKDREFWSKQGMKERGKAIAKKGMPFAFSGNNLGLAVPKSTGASYYSIKQRFKEAFESGKSKDKTHMRAIVRDAKRNKINWKGLHAKAEREYNYKLDREKREKRGKR